MHTNVTLPIAIRNVVQRTSMAHVYTCVLLVRPLGTDVETHDTVTAFGAACLKRAVLVKSTYKYGTVVAVELSVSTVLSTRFKRSDEVKGK